MHLKIIHKVLVFIILFWLLGCSNDYNPNLLKPKAKNNFGEILFALDKKYWKDDLGQQIKSSFENLVKTTPLPYEKEYITDFVVPNKILKNIKNNNCFIFVEIENYNPKKTTPIIKTDLWASGQLIIELKFNSKNSAINYFKTNSNDVKSILKDFNLKKISSNFSKNNNLNLVLKDFVDLNFKAPKGFNLNKKSQNFWWWSKLEIQKDQNGSHEIQKGIILYETPYLNKSQFEGDFIISLNDSIGKKFLLGKDSSSFMQTAKTDFSSVIDTSFYINNKYVRLIKGCWTMTNDKMGGPFISYSWLSNNNSKVITVQGYIYAPNFKKSKFLRTMEAIIVSGIN